MNVENELRFLLLEDEPTDAAIIEEALREAGFRFAARCVATRPDFARALTEFAPDLILADYSLPAFDAHEALQITRELTPRVPVIVVTGALPDERAVELLGEGARDYVLKDRLSRLGPAVRRVLAEVHATEALRKSEQDLREAQRLAHVGSWEWDIASDTIHWSEEYYRIYGIDPARRPPGYEEHLKAYTPESAARLDAAVKRNTQRGEAYEIDLELARTDGPRRWVTARSETVRDAGGKVVGLRGTAQDITERKRAEGVLRDSEQNYRTLADAAPALIWTAGTDKLCNYFNQPWLRFTGRTLQQESGNGWTEGVHPDDLDQCVATYLAAFDRREPFSMEYRLRRQDGQYRWMRDDGCARFDSKGEFIGYLGYVMDITERKQQELALQKVNRALRTLSACNEALVHAVTEPELLNDICRLVIESGGHRMAWVGFAEHDPGKTVRPAAYYGHEDGFLAEAKITWADEERGRGPSGTAIRSGTAQVNQDFLTNPAMAPWRDLAQERGYRSSIALPLVNPAGPFGALTIYASEPDAFNADEVRLLEELAGDLAFGIEAMRMRAEGKRIAKAHLHDEAMLRHSLEDSIAAIAETVAMRDPYTAGHQRRVGKLAVAIAREMELPEETIHGIELAASVHDLGKVQCPAEILSKPGKLTDIEFMLIKQHSQAGYEILKDIQFPWPIATMVWQHHERLDGTGYPQGLKGDQILLQSRIMAVADVVEAMSSHRPYRPALGSDAALKEIVRGQGTIYDAAVVDACVKVFAEKRFAFTA